MKQIDIKEAQTNLAHWVKQANAGKVFIIAESGMPMAELTPLTKKRGIKLGLMAGKIQVAEAFDAPLPKAVIHLFENGELMSDETTFGYASADLGYNE